MNGICLWRGLERTMWGRSRQSNPINPIKASLAAAVFAAPSLLHAGNVTWVNTTTSGNWSTGSHWSTNSVPQAGDAVYLLVENANINNNVSFDVATNLHYASLQIAATKSSPSVGHGITLNIAANTLTVTGTQTVGDSTGGAHGNGSGTVNNSGGVNNVQTITMGVNQGDSGFYTLSSTGTLSSTNFTLGLSGNGFVVQTGGKDITGQMVMGFQPSSGAHYNLQDGSLVAANIQMAVGGNATFIQSGGTASVTSEMDMGVFSGPTALYQQSAGTLSVASLQMGQNAGGQATFSVSSTGLLSATTLDIGASGAGDFEQSGGNVTASLFIAVADHSGSTGTYNLSAGTLTSNNTYVGQDGTGSFDQSGGTHSASRVYLGSGSGTGSYNLHGTGFLSITNELQVGASGAGTFTQSDSLTVVGTPSLIVGVSVGSTGVYALNGGQLYELPGGLEQIGFQGTGTVLQPAGSNYANTLTVGAFGFGNGTYSLSGTGLVSMVTEKVGDFGNGIFIQSGGTNTFTGQLSIGIATGATGSYLLSGSGVLSAGGEVIGDGSIGTFVQTGGTNTVTNGFTVGHNNPSAASLGIYSLGSTGVLSVTGGETIGASGPGTFVQSGGTNTLTNSNLGIFGSGDGSVVYDLSGGVVGVSTIGLNTGIQVQGAVVSVHGGTLTAVSTLTMSNATGTAVNLSSGAVSVGVIEIDGNTFSQTGGTLTTSMIDQEGGKASLGGPQVDYFIGNLTASAGTIAFTNDAAKMLHSSSITVAGTGLIDLAKNSAIIQSSGNGVDAELALLESYIGLGALRTSSGTAITTLGILKAADYKALHQSASQFQGEAFGSFDILIKYTYAGDADLDGKVGLGDYALIDAGFFFGYDGTHPFDASHPAHWLDGDFNYDGVVNYKDYALIDAAFAQQSGVLAASEIDAHGAEFGQSYITALAAIEATVPEPASLALLLLAAPALIRRRR